MLITGRFTDYPLPLLLEIFLHRSETGVLEISSPTESGHIYFKDGKLIDAALGKQVGIEAVSFAETLTDSSFRFNSLPPAEYACLVWEKSLESRRNRPTDLHARALAVYSGIRKSLVYTTTACFSMAGNLRSSANALLAQANPAFERQKQATRTWLAVLQRRVGDWQTGLSAQQIQLPHERISDLIPLQLRERIAAFVRKAQFLSPLNQEPLRRNSLAVVTMAVVGAMLLISVRQVEPRRNQMHTSQAGNESGKLGMESQTPSTLVFSGPAGLPNDSPRTSPLLTRKSNADDERSRQRSIRKIPTENERDTRITKRSRSLGQEKTLASTQPHANIPDESASSQAQVAPTRVVQAIQVELQIEDGRVSQASLTERRPGMESYEAAALRIARQRRYPAGLKRKDTVVVKFNNSHSN